MIQNQVVEVTLPMPTSDQEESELKTLHDPFTQPKSEVAHNANSSPSRGARGVRQFGRLRATFFIRHEHAPFRSRFDGHRRKLGRQDLPEDRPYKR